MNKPHKHYKLMADYAQDAAETETPWERWEYKSHDGGWAGLDANPEWYVNFEYRRKPKTININGIEVPEPMRERPEIGTKYYFADPSAMSSDNMQMTWADDSLDNQWLLRGFCHATREAAELHAKALLSFTKQPE